MLSHESMDELVRALAERRVDRLAYRGLRELAADLKDTLGLVLFDNEDDLPRAERIVETRNHDNTREMIPLLERIPPERWTPELIAEVEKAPSENNQVRECNLDGEGVPEVVKRILAKLAIPLDSDFADDDIPF